jgi:hypothetical protein
LYRTDGAIGAAQTAFMGKGVLSKAEQYRALAKECERRASEATSEKERDEMLRRADGYRALAETEDWLQGQPTKPSK